MPHPALLLLGVFVLCALVISVPRLLTRAIGSLRIARALRPDHGSRHTDMALIAAYHDRVVASTEAESLDERTWADLNLDDVFLGLDRTASEPGRQYLYHLLRSQQAAIEPLQRLDRAAHCFDTDAEIGTRVRAALERLSDPRAAELEQLLFGELQRRPRLWWMFPVLTAGALTCLALATVWPLALFVWLGICVVNVGVQVMYKPRIKAYDAALHAFPAFLRATAELGALDQPELAEAARVLEQGAKKLSALRLTTSWLMFESRQTSEGAASLYEYFNLLFLLDINAFVFSVESLRASRDIARGMFEALAWIDAAQSVAAWRRSLTRWTCPEFVPAQKALHIEELFHPLLASPVANSLDIENGSVLITGSNMSGKTTFVRTLGVNTVLAQSLYTVCARVWRAPMLRVRSSIVRADSLMEGKSYYMSEVESVRSLVRAKTNGHQHLFLLDELFRGTNTAERVAAGYAVLAHLNEGLDLVIVATHDVELLELLRGTYAAHHFREQVTDDGLSFDYRIRLGASSTRNAIALLKVMQYPAAVVAKALAVLEERRVT